MSDLPILFSAPMVQALIREARKPGTGKTQTRRRLAAQAAGMHLDRVGPTGWQFTGEGGAPRMPVRIRYSVGDRLWVKETALYWIQNVGPEAGRRSKVAAFAADGYELEAGERWTPSLFMERRFSRLTLIITDVRVEPLQDISRADALAEGVERESADPPFYYVPGVWPHSLTAVGIEEPGGRHAERCYLKLWDHINGAGSAAENPWVVALTFTAHLRNIDAPMAESGAD